MQFNKKILMIAVSISFYGAIIGMQKNTPEQLTLNISCNNAMIKKLWEQLNLHMEQVEKEAAKQGDDLANLILFSNLNKQNITPLATWLAQQKSSFPNQQWHQIVQKLSSSILMYNHNNHPKSKEFETVEGIITKIAYKLNSDEDCSELLANSIAKGLSDL